jgi:hypothetical protein
MEHKKLSIRRRNISFLDGLQPAVRVLVAIQQPVDLDTSYTLALLYEELADGVAPASSHFGAHGHSTRRPQAHPLPPPPPVPPAKWTTKPIEEKTYDRERPNGCLGQVG